MISPPDHFIKIHEKASHIGRQHMQHSINMAQQLKSMMPSPAADEWQNIIGSISSREISRIYSEIEDNKLKQAIEYYNSFPYVNADKKRTVVWEKGSAKIYYFAPAKTKSPQKASSIVIFPSLINSYYIHDLTEKRSMAEYFATQGIHTFIIDWGIPGEEEKNFDINDYVMKYGIPAIEHVRNNYACDKTIIAGHCLGGMMAISAAIYKPNIIDGIALLGTPWDFASELPNITSMMQPYEQNIRESIEKMEFFSSENLALFFYFKDPKGYRSRLLKILDKSKNNEELKTAIAIEQWVNDVNDISKRTAINCFCDFAINNQAASGEWMIGEKTVLPGEISCPTLLVVATKDNIVPPSSAKMLEEKISNIKTIKVNSGHIGMIAGRNAKAAIWDKVLEWVKL